VDVEKVLAIWRASVPAEVRRQWLVIDPHELDRVRGSADEDSDEDSLVPLQRPIRQAARTQPPATSGDRGASELWGSPILTPSTEGSVPSTGGLRRGRRVRFFD
jgi:hypothetical protein